MQAFFYEMDGKCKVTCRVRIRRRGMPNMPKVFNSKSDTQTWGFKTECSVFFFLSTILPIPNPRASPSQLLTFQSAHRSSGTTGTVTRISKVSAVSRDCIFRFYSLLLQQHLCLPALPPIHHKN